MHSYQLLLLYIQIHFSFDHYNNMSKCTKILWEQFFCISFVSLFNSIHINIDFVHWMVWFYYIFYEDFNQFLKLKSYQTLTYLYSPNCRIHWRRIVLCESSIVILKFFNSWCFCLYFIFKCLNKYDLKSSWVKTTIAVAIWQDKRFIKKQYLEQQ